MAEFSLDNLYLDEALIDVRHPDSLFFNDKKAELVSKLGNILPNYSIQPDNTIALFNPEMKTNANISINRFGLTYSEPKDVDEFILFVKSFSKTVLDFQKTHYLK
ncbi:hypothetical protein D2962_09660 [Biomaibacter acetigenes]|uniref:Uncharacterized protein n=1 Tax=Biomaibacter acetigenes TaxID=2316383 RepID=A0A3G2R651_9FIRM|nr:hypothetical protein [Biomaibacter acetigenes]AYO30845.1 hypothetical protein D2962_09660 [Biomaibacter acetigenes]